MQSAYLTCRCKACHRPIPYERSNAGVEVICPGCRKPVFLPGNLQPYASIRATRKYSVVGICMEVGGFCLLPFFPYGTMAGLPIIYIGYRNSKLLVCSSCEELIASPSTKACPGCHALFVKE